MKLNGKLAFSLVLPVQHFKVLEIYIYVDVYTYMVCQCIYMCVNIKKMDFFKVLQHSKKKLESVDENPRPKVPMVTQY